METDALLARARQGDIKAFHSLFAAFQPQLKSYLYRLTADRNETEDLAHDTFIQAFDNIQAFAGRSSLKTWVFTIATHAATKRLKKKKRWREDTMEHVRRHAHAGDEAGWHALQNTHRYDPYGAFELREHIDFCFTCTAMMVPIEQQIALILKDVYDFKVKEIATIMEKTHGTVKHLLHKARTTMVRIFDDQCALVSKRGACNQCSALNGRFNPRQHTQAALMRLEMVRDAARQDKQALYELRATLVKAIDPLQATGTGLHEVFFRLGHEVNGTAP